MEDSGDDITAERDLEWPEFNADLLEPNRSGDSPTSDQTVYYNPEHLDDENPDTIQLSQELDPEMVSAIRPIDENPEFGEDIHKILSEAWLPLLKKGMTNEEKDKILKEYPVPGNCRLLQAPKLNEEISVAVDVSVREQDQTIAATQQQLGHGITALNRALNILIKISTVEVRKAVEHLSKSCRILCDLHASSTQKRINLITPKLDETLLNAIQGTERDDTLFGNKLSEKIKHIKNQGQTKKPDLVQPKMSNNTSSTRNRKLSGQAENELNLPSTSRTPTAQNNQKHRNVTQKTQYTEYKEFIQQSFIARGGSAEEAISKFENMSETTRKTYDSTYKQWWNYCIEKKVDTFKPSEASVLDFFMDLVMVKGRAYRSLNGHRKALNLVLGDIVNNDNVDIVIKKQKNAKKQKAKQLNKAKKQKKIIKTRKPAGNTATVNINLHNSVLQKQ